MDLADSWLVVWAEYRFVRDHLVTQRLIARLSLDKPDYEICVKKLGLQAWPQ